MKKLSSWLIIIVVMLLSSCSSIQYKEKGDVLYDEPTSRPTEPSY